LGLAHLVSARQVHGDRIQRVAGGKQEPGEVDGCDALLTNEPGIGLLVQHADCQAVMLHDPRQQAVANIHAGWRGSVLDIIAKTIHEMQKQFGTDPADLRAGVSPSLGPCCAEFVNYRQELPPELHPYQGSENHFDFWAVSRDQLQACGVQKENIAVAGICTRCNENYFSYRRQKQTGRCGSVIGLR
jgi:YfiH family protein